MTGRNMVDDTLRYMIREGNKIIAEFDGWSQDGYPEYLGRWHRGKDEGTKRIDDFTYNKSLDALATVCQKFLNLPNVWGENYMHLHLCGKLSEAMATFDTNKIFPVLRDAIKEYNKAIALLTPNMTEMTPGCYPAMVPYGGYVLTPGDVILVKAALSFYSAAAAAYVPFEDEGFTNKVKQLLHKLNNL